MKSQAASTGIRLLRLAASFATDSTNESTDVTASLAVAADGRYYVDPGGKAPHAGMERVVCDGEHRWLWAGNRLFCWPPEPLPKGIAAFMDPAPLIRSHGRQGGTTEVDGRTGRTVTASFPRLVPVTAPLSLHSMSADEAEFVIDDRLGVALRARWIHQGEALLCTELANVTETVDDQLFRVEPPPGMRVTTTRNPLAFVTAREVTESARLFTTDLAKWISRPRH